MPLSKEALHYKETPFPQYSPETVLILRNAQMGVLKAGLSSEVTIADLKRQMIVFIRPLPARFRASILPSPGFSSELKDMLVQAIGRASKADREVIPADLFFD